MYNATSIDEAEFLPTAWRIALTSVGKAVRWGFVASVVYGTDWYEWLKIVSASQGAA